MGARRHVEGGGALAPHRKCKGEICFSYILVYIIILATDMFHGLKMCLNAARMPLRGGFAALPQIHS